MIIKYCSNSQEKENRTGGKKGEILKMANLIYNINNYIKYKRSKWTTEKTDLKTGLRSKNDPTTCCLQETHINYNDKGRPNIKRIERDTRFKH